MGQFDMKHIDKIRLSERGVWFRYYEYVIPKWLSFNDAGNEPKRRYTECFISFTKKQKKEYEKILGE